MKKFFLPLFAMLILMACEKQNPVELLESNTSNLRAQKVNICHDGQILNVSINALQAHQAHGDAVDMDGDGFFNIPSDCGTEVDCDDNNYDLDNACCTSGDYPTIVVDGRTWIAKNLNIATAGSICYDNDPTNCVTYGRLYTYAAAETACAQLGDCWRVPTKEEWTSLVDASTYNDLIAGGSSGFDALLGGGKASGSNTFIGLGTFGDYWTSTVSTNNIPRNFAARFHANGTINLNNDRIVYAGSSCRCIKE